MARTTQRPDAAKAGGDPHDFTQQFSDWEASVFDGAEYFFALRLGPRERVEFATFAEAAAWARDRRGYCLYAVTPSGRSAVLDRDAWDEWAERERRTRAARSKTGEVPERSTMRNMADDTLERNTQRARPGSGCGAGFSTTPPSGCEFATHTTDQREFHVRRRLGRGLHSQVGLKFRKEKRP